MSSRVVGTVSRSYNVMANAYDLRRERMGRGRQLLTPHPSSSTQHFSSSPARSVHTRKKVLPSRQVAVPPSDGSWLTIGRSSISSDVALPASNRWASRVHASVRYIKDEAGDEAQLPGTIEVKCHGYNGLTLHIGREMTFVKRDKIVACNLAKLDAPLSIEITGSLVHINAPVCATTVAGVELDSAMPSSPPAMYCDDDDSEAVETLPTAGVIAMDVPQAAYGLASPRSSPPRQHNNLPSSLPSSPLSQRHANAASHRRPQVASDEDAQKQELTSPKHKRATGKENLDPKSTRPTTPRRLSTPRSPLPTVFEEDEVVAPIVEDAIATDAVVDDPAVEQTPVEAKAAVVDVLVADEPAESLTPVAIDEPCVDPPSQAEEAEEPAVLVSDIVSALPQELTEVSLAEQESTPPAPELIPADAEVQDAVIEDLPMLEPIVDAPKAEETVVAVAEPEAVQAPSTKESAPSVSDTAAKQPEGQVETLRPDAVEHVELGTTISLDNEQADENAPESTALDHDADNREDFTDMILTALASSTLSPTPLSYFVPFFPADTPQTEVEEFLRAQPAAAEVKREGKDASGQQLRSQWYYAPEKDDNHDRSARLALLVKPIRSTRKQHKQYYWRPVASIKRVDPTGLIERKSNKRRK